MVLGMYSVPEHTEVIVTMGSETLCVVGRHNLDIERLSYTYLSRVLAQIFSSLTAPLGFDGTKNVDVIEFQMNLEPYLRVHFMFSSDAPIISAYEAHHETLSVAKITVSGFEPDLMMVKCRPRHGKEGSFLDENSPRQYVCQRRDCCRSVVWCLVATREMSGWSSQQPDGTSLWSLDDVAAAMKPFSDA